MEAVFSSKDGLVSCIKVPNSSTGQFLKLILQRSKDKLSTDNVSTGTLKWLSTWARISLFQISFDS